MILPIYLIYLLLKSGFSRNVPPHESFQISYGPSLEYTWRNNSKYHVGIYNQQLYCCSTLLTLEHALTTAGCFEPLGTDVTKMLAYGGTIFHYHHDPRAQVRAVKEVVIHENYSIFGAPDNDIALAVVTPPFVETYRITTARLPNRLFLNSKKYIPLYSNLLRMGSETDGMIASITMNGMRIMGTSSLDCKLCNDMFKAEGEYYDENGTVVDKLICYRGQTRRYKQGDTLPLCYGGLGCPLMTYDHEIIAMQSIPYSKNCSRYTESPEIYERKTGCGNDFEVRSIQVFYYVDWIKSNIKKKKLTRFRPFRVSSKKINIKPHIPLLVNITLLAIVIVVFLVCNRAVFGRIRF